MKNLAHIPEENLEVLPSHDKVHPEESARYYRRVNFPWTRVHRFLRSRVGQNVDKVFAEFVRATWIPKHSRNYAKFCSLVETKTFIKDNKVFYYDNYYSWNLTNTSTGHEKPVESIYCYRCGEQLYVHPVSKLLCSVTNKSKAEREKRALEITKNCTMHILGDFHQLLKIDGIWYEVWAEFKYESHKKYYNSKNVLIDESNHPNFSGSRYYYWGLYPSAPCGTCPKIRKRQLNSKELKKYNLKNAK